MDLIYQNFNHSVVLKIQTSGTSTVSLYILGLYVVHAVKEPNALTDFHEMLNEMPCQRPNYKSIKCLFFRDSRLFRTANVCLKMATINISLLFYYDSILTKRLVQSKFTIWVHIQNFCCWVAWLTLILAGKKTHTLRVQADTVLRLEEHNLIVS